VKCLAAICALAVVAACGSSRDVVSPSSFVVLNYVGSPSIPMPATLTTTVPGEPAVSQVNTTQVSLPLNFMLERNDDGRLGGQVSFGVASPMPPCAIAGTVDQFSCQSHLTHQVIYDDHTIHWPHQAIGILEDTIWIAIAGRVVGDSAIGTLSYQRSTGGTMTDSVTLKKINVVVHQGPGAVGYSLY
jgi:hypothetical protein